MEDVAVFTSARFRPEDKPQAAPEHPIVRLHSAALPNTQSIDTIELEKSAFNPNDSSPSANMKVEAESQRA